MKLMATSPSRGEDGELGNYWRRFLLKFSELLNSAAARKAELGL